jgi:hypothetical protein
MGTQPRDQLVHFLSDKDGVENNRIGSGFEELSSSKNAQTQEKHYIDGTSEVVTTTYQTAWAVNGNVYSDNKVNDMLFDMARKEVKGDDAVRKLTTVYLWEPSENNPETVFKAFQQEVSFVPDNDGGGSAEETVSFSGTLNARGDRTWGWATLTMPAGKSLWTCVFSETEPPEPA